MIRLDRVTLREIHLALKEPFRISSGVQSERRMLLLELQDEDGASVWAECVAFEAPIYTSETIDTAWLALREWLAPRLLGHAVDRAAESHARLATNIRGSRDGQSRPRDGLLGPRSRPARPPAVAPPGRRPRRPAERRADRDLLGLQATPAALVERALAAVAAGYQKVKLKIEPGRDVAFVAPCARRWGRTSSSWRTPTPRIRWRMRRTTRRCGARRLRPLDAGAAVGGGRAVGARRAPSGS